jgi:transcriptional regulator
MYKKPYFMEEDRAAIMAFMQAHPFVTLIGAKEGVPVATQVPVIIEEDEVGLVLIGHIMKGTDHHRAFQQNTSALVLFTGPHCYVSSSWYTEAMGATWNYQTVHARGTLNLLGAPETIDIIRRLTEQYEREQEHPLFIDRLPAEEVAQAPKAIAGFRMVVEELSAVFKLSQNRDDESYVNIVKQLRKNGNVEEERVAEEMVKRRDWLFGLDDDLGKGI